MLNVEKIKLNFSWDINRLIVTCLPTSFSKSDKISVSTDITGMKEIEYVPKFMVVTNLLQSILNELLNELFEKHLKTILDTYIHFNDPLYKIISDRLLYNNSRDELYKVYFSEKDLFSLRQSIKEHLED